MNIQLVISEASHLPFAKIICELIELSARQRKTGIAKRAVGYIEQKIKSGNAVIAFNKGQLIGFCYIETWSDKNYVANSGLVVHPDFRGKGLARKIKQKAFNHAREKYPHAKVFGITTSPAVMKINSELGYIPVSFAQLTKDDAFWNGCQSCPNYDILQRNQRRICLCTGMLAISKNEELNIKKSLDGESKEEINTGL